jgi:hypothetical protein
MRGFTNERAEFLMAVLPVATTGPADSSPLAFPFFADGDGWKSQILLVNPTDSTISGVLDFFGQPNTGDQTFSVFIPGQPSESARYNIPRGSAVMIQTALPRTEYRTGWVRLTPSNGTAKPTGLLVYSQEVNGVTISQSGIAAMHEGSGFRVYAETQGRFRARESDSIQTVVALGNFSKQPATIRMELLTMDGVPTGLTSMATVPALGHARLFMDQMPGFLKLEGPFKGFIRITGDPVSVTELTARYNERGDLLFGAMPAILETELTIPSGAHHYFAHGAGYTTSFIAFSSAGSPSVLQ